MNASQISTVARNLVDADTVSLTNATLLIYANNALDEIVSKLITIDQKWVFGDENRTTEPTYTVSLTNGTRAYDFPSSTLVNLFQVTVLDNNANWHTLIPITLDEMGVPQLEFFETNGRPQYYEKRDNFVFLYPAPDNGVSVTLTNGLRYIGQRSASLFTDMTSTSETPGFHIGYHQLIAYKAVIPYALSYKPERVGYISSEIRRMEVELVDFYANKSRDQHHLLQARRITFR
jgi:hypothetical protein